MLIHQTVAGCYFDTEQTNYLWIFAIIKFLITFYTFKKVSV